MGDFYYPSFSCTAQSYQFMATAPKASISEASLAVPNTPVYAREWDLKYVTQFYTSPELRTADKVNFGTSGYVCYAPFQASTSTSPGLYGTHNSWNGEQGQMLILLMILTLQIKENGWLVLAQMV